jgi:cation diffusion facilitator CzcD-associated flavoprotein CzcO
MNPCPSHPASRRGFIRIILLAALAILVVLPLTAGAVLYLAFRPGTEVRALRQCVERAVGTGLDRQVQLAVRPLAFSLARAVCSRIDDVPPEARQALQAARRADVGVYRLSAPTAVSAARVFEQADRVMEAEGWERTVGVVEGANIVAVFSPRHSPSDHDLSFCVLVFDGQQVVAVLARTDPRPLIDLALAQAASHLQTARRH